MDPLTMPARLSVRLRSEDRELLALAARRSRLRISDFVRQAVMRAAAQAVGGVEQDCAA